VVRDWSPLLYTYQGSAGPWHTFTRCGTGS
jgi:hypothetical protein